MPENSVIDTLEAQLVLLMANAKDHINGAKLARSKEERNERLDAALDAINFIGNVFDSVRETRDL